MIEIYHIMPVLSLLNVVTNLQQLQPEFLAEKLHRDLALRHPKGALRADFSKGGGHFVLRMKCAQRRISGV